MKNKKNLFIIIICGLALTMMPSFVFAADSYRCWCGNTDSTAQFGWPACETECPKQCTIQQLSGKPTCDLIKSAQTPAPSPSGTKGIFNPLGTADLPTLIGQIIKAVLGIVGSIALLMFIYGGFLWLTSSGNEQRITKGKQVLTWAVIGLAIIFLSYTLVGFIISGLTKGAAGEGNLQPLASGGCCSTSITCFNVNSEAECKSTGAGSNKFFSGMKCTDIGGAMVCS